jgi:hypothetical protein
MEIDLTRSLTVSLALSTMAIPVRAANKPRAIGGQQSRNAYVTSRS